MATSIEPALFDAWGAAPLASRPLSDEARERIIDAWSEVADRVTGRPRLELVLPAAERASVDEASIVEAIHLDLRSMKTEARHHRIRSALNPRESRIGILVFFVSLSVAAVIDVGSDDGGLATLLSQTFIVLAWVALWAPAHRLLTAASFRLGRRYFAELGISVKLHPGHLLGAGS